MNTLAQSFAEASDQAKKDKKIVPSAPIIVKNHLGKPITVLLDNRYCTTKKLKKPSCQMNFIFFSFRSFKYYVQGSRPGLSSEIVLDHDSEVYLVLYRDRNHKAFLLIVC